MDNLDKRENPWTIIFDEEEDNDEDTLGKRIPNFVTTGVSEEERQEELQRRAAHIYENFVEPVFEDIQTTFSLEELQEEVRPPYSQSELEKALQYGIENNEIIYDEEKDRYILEE